MDKKKNLQNDGTSSLQVIRIYFFRGAGFIGSHITVHFVTQYPEFQIVVLDKLTHCASKKNLKEIECCKNFEFIQGDIRSSDLVRHIFTKYEIDTVIHIAAETHVGISRDNNLIGCTDHSFGDPLSFVRTNVEGTHVLLECSRERWVQKKFNLFLHMSTDEVYGESSLTDKSWEGKKETFVLMPTNPYAASKAGGELLVQSYHHSFQLPVIITRGNNTYGPKQYPEKLIPKFITLLQRNKPLCIYGTGKNLRCYLFVSDLVKAYDMLMHKGVIGEIYNIGSTTEYSNNEVSEQLCRLLNKDVKEFMHYVKDRPKNDLRYLINCEKILALGWKPVVSFEKGLQLTVDWYNNNEHTHHWSGIESALESTPHQMKRDNAGHLQPSHSIKSGIKQFSTSNDHDDKDNTNHNHSNGQEVTYKRDTE
ncbi:hypothetical protein RFI_08183 [Reticulomyxa filosa]|uniref:NAD(P)-binding domain-containing protein n=1 Tax=Reticulomyxa filosa TaxID=46433 RepID=X6NT81_RETFI|nr:hypothetical protein RFI_08183 [Reticulomyxa filosa]|eukprot:ETO28944.1 hypothetical protein RFI_08183 [Reticulomyxa filosa]